MRVSGIKGGAPRASPLPQDVLYTFSWRYILLGGRGAACVGRFVLEPLLRAPGRRPPKPPPHSSMNTEPIHSDGV